MAVFKSKRLPVFKKDREKNVKKLIDCVEDLIEIVEGVRCEPWWSVRTGSRLKDTEEWVSLYSAFHKINE